MKTWPLLFIPVLTLSGLTVWNEANAQPPAISYPGVVVPTHTAVPLHAPAKAFLPSPGPGPAPSDPAEAPQETGPPLLNPSA
jgi:hypothetical protein